jgi:pyruvate-formate lyase
VEVLIKVKNETIRYLLQEFEITPRVKKLREDLLSVKRELCVERALLVTQSYQETEGEPTIIRRAKGLAKILDNMTVNIYKEELIVGNQACNRRYGILFPDMAWKWIDEEIDTFATRAEYFLVSSEKKKKIREI